MGNSNAAKEHPLDAHFDVGKYKRMRPHFSEQQIVSLWDLFKTFEPDQSGYVSVEKVREIFRKSSDRDQLKEYL